MMDRGQHPSRPSARDAAASSPTPQPPRRHSLTTAPHDVVHRHEQIRLPLGRETSERRELVIHRLLAHGISARTLRALLPEWDDLITAVAGERQLSSAPRR